MEFSQLCCTIHLLWGSERENNLHQPKTSESPSPGEGYKVMLLLVRALNIHSGEEVKKRGEMDIKCCQLSLANEPSALLLSLIQVWTCWDIWSTPGRERHRCTWVGDCDSLEGPVLNDSHVSMVNSSWELSRGCRGTACSVKIRSKLLLTDGGWMTSAPSLSPEEMWHNWSLVRHWFRNQKHLF